MSDLLNQASLVMVPSGYKEDTVYSVVPSDGSGDLSFTRASNGTRINSAGLVEVAPWNLYTYSEIFSGGGWFNDGTSTATDNFTTAPNGTTTAAKVVANTNNGYAYKSSVVTPNTYTLSYYVRASANTTMSIAINDPGGSGSSIKSNIAITTQWQRIEHSALVTLGTSFYIDYAGLQTGVDYFIWGAQLNIGSTAKPYFPTTDRLNVPRLTYQNGGGGCPSLLLEKQSTNIITYSEDFLNTAWVKADASISSNSAISPDGTQNADKIIPNTNNASHPVYQVIGTGAVSSVTLFAKPAGYNFVQIYGGNASGTSMRFSVVINLTNGTIDTIDTITSGQVTINAMINGWYKITVNNFTNFTGGSYFLAISAIPSSGLSRIGGLDIVYTGNGTDGVFVWGAQVEESSYSTSYIPTTSSSATRVADACLKTGISSLIGQTEGTLFADFVFSRATDEYAYFSIQNASASSRVRVTYTRSSNTMQIDLVIGGSASIIYTFNPSDLQRYKIAVGYKSGDSVAYINGSQVGTQSATFTFTDLSSLNYDNPSASGTQPMTGKHNQTILFPTRLTNAELASLTTL